jgi:hypothetical protein
VQQQTFGESPAHFANGASDFYARRRNSTPRASANASGACGNIIWSIAKSDLGAALPTSDSYKLLG